MKSKLNSNLAKGIRHLLEKENPDQDTIETADDYKTYKIPLVQIIPDPNQPWEADDEKSKLELAASVKIDGILQPILIRPVEGYKNGIKYMVVYGHSRRWAAAKNNFEKIACFIRKLTDEQAFELQFIENIHRRNMHPMQEAKAFERLHNRLTLEEIADRIGKSISYISVRLRLNALNEIFQKIYLAGKIDFEDAKKISRATPDTQKKLLNEKVDVPGAWEADGWSLGNYEYILKREHQDIAKATFSPTDQSLYPEMGACINCRFNSAHNLFGDVDGSICYNLACFNIKTERQYQFSLEAAAAASDILLVADNNAGTADDRIKIKQAAKISPEKYISEGWQPAGILESPTWDHFLKSYQRPDGSLTESEDYIRSIFEEEYNSWQDANNNYLDAVKEGRVRKAFIVAGEGKGQVKDVVIRKNADHTAPLSIPDLISELQKQEDEDALEDPGRLYRQIADRIKDDPAFINNANSLNASESIGLCLYLFDTASYHTQCWLLIQLGLRIKEDTSMPFINQEGYERMKTALTADMLNIFIRRTIAAAFTRTVVRNPDADPQAMVMKNIASRYLPGDVKQIELDQEKIIKTRRALLEEKITALKHVAITGDKSM